MYRNSTYPRVKNRFTRHGVWNIQRPDREYPGAQPGMIAMIDVLNAKETEASEITTLTGEEIDQVAGGSGLIRSF